MRGLLVRGLRPRRHRGGLARARTGRAVADREDVRVAGGLQCRLDDELVDAVDLQPIEAPQHLRGFYAGRPHHQFRGNKRAVGQTQTVRYYFRHLGSGVDLDANAVEQAARRFGDPFRQAGQDAVGSLDQYDTNVALRINAIVPVGDHFARGATQLGSQFGARRAGADDRHVKLAGTYRTLLRLGTNAGV